MLMTMMPFEPAAHVPISVKNPTSVVAPSARNVGAIARVAISHPERATHCRIQMTKKANTTVNPKPPPKTRLWNT